LTTYYLKIKEWFDRQPQADKDKLPALFAITGVGLIAAQSLVFMDRLIAAYIFIALSLIVARLLGKKITLGPKWMYIPLLTIVGIVFLRAAIYSTSIHSVTTGTFEIGFISLMFCGYLAGRVCGRDIFYLLPFVAIILALFIYANAIIRPDNIMYNLDYNLLSATLILATVLTTWQRKWIIVAITLPAIFLTGASEGILALGIIFIMVLLRKDFTAKLWLPAGALSVVFLATFYTGTVDTIYARAYNIITETAETSGLSQRIDGYRYALQDIKYLGHSYNPTNTERDSIHNVPLRALYELGPIVAIAWCFAMLVGLFKTRYKYAFAAIIAFALFDHLMWTWLAPIPWLIAGVATVDKEGDLLFRKENIKCQVE